MRKFDVRSQQYPTQVAFSTLPSEHGFGLIELMVSMAIASFLVLGLVTMAGNFQTTYTAQTNLAAIHDKERFASAIFGAVLQGVGYYSTSYNSTAETISSNTSVLTQVSPGAAPGAAYQSGQFLAGSATAGGGGPDVLNVRYYFNATDPSLTAATWVPPNCLGSNPNPLVTGVFESVLSISNGNLICQIGLNGAAPTNAAVGGTANSSVILIDGVTNLQLFYNVQNGANLQYFRAADMTAALWTSVKAVKVQLQFTDPPGTLPTPQTYTFTQTYQVMYGAP